ncbi:MAG TPA: TA system VapC family ribonuclease toxin [Actinopolymorphaceae bacterium]|nr:TA system VapC family ribonuclease toxin [Actinopolymorphaceae bacterium]
MVGVLPRATRDLRRRSLDGGSPFHRPASEWLENALDGVTRVGFPWASLTAFCRLSTHPRASTDPMSPTEAWEFVDDWLDADPAFVPVPTTWHPDVLRRLLVDHDLRGNLVPDAHLAALAIEHGVGICSADSDFARFPSSNGSTRPCRDD